MTVWLSILGTLAACMVAFAVAYALGMRVPPPLALAGGILIVLIAAATLGSIVLLDMRDGVGRAPAAAPGGEAGD